MELLIVVAVVGLLSSLALPRFLGARDDAEAGARIGQLVGLAKECATFISSSGLGNAPEGCTAGMAASFSASWSPRASGLQCLNARASEGASAATISITSNGAMQCVFS